MLINKQLAIKAKYALYVKYKSKRYCNISRKIISYFIQLCRVCQEKNHKQINKGVVVKPILSSDFNSRGQVDLMNFESQAFKSFNGIVYKNVMHYQDNLTKFSHLRALQPKRAAGVTYHLVDIWFNVGASGIVQVDIMVVNL